MLRDSGVRFAAVDLPEANDLTVGIMALVAQRSARRSRGGPRRRWRWPGAAGCGSATPTARRRSGGLARAVRRSGRRLRGTPTGMRGTRTGRRETSAPVARRAWGDRRRAERPRHADPTRRALARLDGDEPARPARAQEGGMRQSRLMSLVEAVANVVIGLLVAVATQVVVFPILGLQVLAGPEHQAGAGLHRRVDRSKLRAAAGNRTPGRSTGRAPRSLSRRCSPWRTSPRRSR